MSRLDDEFSGPRRIPEVDKIDLRKLSPIYGMQIQSKSSEPEYLKSSVKGRDIAGKLFFYTGVAWLGGFMTAGAYGFVEGWRGAANPSMRIRLNSVINAVSKRGSKAGNALGSIVFMYTSAIWFTELADLENRTHYEAAVPLVSGFVTGAIYKSTASGRAAVLAGTIGAGASLFLWYGASSAYDELFSGRRKSGRY